MAIAKSKIKLQKKQPEVKKEVAKKLPHHGLIHNSSPLSETLIPKLKSGTKAQCVDDLRVMATNSPEIAISRNYYRVHGKYSESVWNSYFGTFEEFKRQAGLKLTRQQHAHERAIAKHASVDHYRAMNIERLDYGDKYLRENSNRFKTILACSDLHDIEVDPFYLRVLIDTAKRVQPDVISLVGDVLDLPEFGKYGVDPREWDVVGRIKFAHEHILGPLREACPEAQIDFIEGNHECVSIDTEILTEQGWVKSEEITELSKVASYTVGGEEFSYDEPIAIKRINNVEMALVCGDLSNELVSKTHNIDLDNSLTPVINILDEDVNQTRLRYAIDANNAGVALTKNEISLLTWVVCDGTILKRQTTNRRVQFKLSKQRKIDRLKSLLDEMGFKYTFRKATMSVANKLQPYYICLYANEARWVFEKLEGVKQFPASFTNMDKSQLTYFIKDLLDTDGCASHNHSTLRTTSKHDADIVQLICIKNGVACKISENGKSGFTLFGKKQYLVSIFDNGVSNRRYVSIRRAGRGDVIAIQTVNGTLITRREGKVSFTGNCRLLRHLADSTPALRAVLSDLHGFTVGKLLGLEKYEVNYIAKADLGTFSSKEASKELSNNYKIYWETVLCHHFPHAKNMGLPGVNGHHHRHQVWSEFNPIYGAYEWHQMGSGHKRSASYCEGERWHNGFALINVDTKTRSTNFDYVPVTDFAVSGGKWYYRDKRERSDSAPNLLIK